MKIWTSSLVASIGKDMRRFHFRSIEAFSLYFVDSSDYCYRYNVDCYVDMRQYIA